MKEQKGMGHLATILSIAIIILTICGFVYYIKNRAQEEKMQNYETDMLLIQGKVKVLGQEATIQKNEEILKGRKVEENLENEEIKRLLENSQISQDEEKFSKYYILEKENLEEIGLTGIELNEGFFIVNYDTYEIIYSKGVSVEDTICYKLSEIQALAEQSKTQEEQEEAKEEIQEQQVQTEQTEE